MSANWWLCLLTGSVMTLGAGAPVLAKDDTAARMAVLEATVAAPRNTGDERFVIASASATQSWVLDTRSGKLFFCTLYEIDYWRRNADAECTPATKPPAPPRPFFDFLSR